MPEENNCRKVDKKMIHPLLGISEEDKLTDFTIIKKLRTFSYRWIFKIIEKHKNGDVLDVGSKGGQLSDYFKPDVMIDISPERSDIIKMDACNMEFEDEKFDTVVSIQVLEHIKDDEKALSEMARVLRRNGKLILTTCINPDSYSMMDYRAGHYRNYTTSQLIQMFSSVGLEIIDIDKTPIWLNVYKRTLSRRGVVIVAKK